MGRSRCSRTSPVVGVVLDLGEGDQVGSRRLGLKSDLHKENVHFRNVSDHCLVKIQQIFSFGQLSVLSLFSVSKFKTLDHIFISKNYGAGINKGIEPPAFP